MKTENKVAAILFIMAFSTVFLLYAAISADTGNNINETPVIPTNNDIGKTVYVEGTVLSKRMTYTGDNLLINLECRSPANQNQSDGNAVVIVFVPKSTGSVSINQKLNVGDKIGVKGAVEEYNGTPEVILKNEKNLLIF
jgi:DNA/RNA endonuclease YhcR with UshA esterase domain